MALITLLLSDAFNTRNRQRLGVDHLCKRGHNLKCLDVSDIVHPMVNRDRSDYRELCKDMDIRHISDAHSLSGLVDEVSKSDLIMNFAESGILTMENWPIMRFIAKTGVPYLVQCSNAYPGWRRYSDSGNIWWRMWDIGQRLSKISVAKFLLSRVSPQFLGIPAPAFIVQGGRQCDGYNRFVDCTTQKIYAHAMDYENFRRVKSGRPKQANTAVFLDEFLPYHPDITMMGVDPPMEAGAYFSAMRGLFDRVENELGLQVTVAACPHADYENRLDLFGNRPVKKFMTAELVAESQLIIAHRSTAINYAVLFRKPIILTATYATYQHSSQTPYFDAFAKTLNKIIQFFDDPANVDFTEAFYVDDTVYDQYIEDYIKISCSPNRPYWDIVFDAINHSRQDFALF